MPYIGHSPTNAGSFTLIDDIASSFSCLVEVVKDLMAKVEALENA